MAVTLVQAPVNGLEKQNMCLGDSILCHLETPNPDGLRRACAQAKRDAQEVIASILNVDDERTYENTIKPLDSVLATSDAALLLLVCETLGLVAPTKEIADIAQEQYVDLRAFFSDFVEHNRDLYDALLALSQDQQGVSKLRKEQRYFLDETLAEFIRAGVSQSDAIRDQARELKQEITKLCADFERNIAEDHTTVILASDLLEGIPPYVYQDLFSNDKQEVVLALDYPTYFTVMETARNLQARKKMYQAFSRRGYPANDIVLKRIIQRRHELAKLLGYDSYASLDLADQMVKDPASARRFLDTVAHSVTDAAARELHELLRAADDSVEVVDGKLQPWDLRYLKNEYKKRFMDYDEEQIAEYFPADYTIAQLLGVYTDLFAVTFERAALPAWHEDVFVYSVLDAHKKVLGHIYFDLYPRKDKYTHACCGGVVPATYDADDAKTVCRAFLIANFPKATAERPGLLKRDDVQTFFHELGHGLHELLGRTALASHAGTRVKTDFVELPSQMLENWVYEPEILKRISRHYKTGKQLSDELIAKIIVQKNFCMSSFVARQIALSDISLSLYSGGSAVDPCLVEQNAYKRYCPKIMIDQAARAYASFGHLTHYAAKYYGYLWSRVFAYDLYDQFKAQGITNPVIGKKYIDAVIGRGGSADPNDLLYAFLDREPTYDAFQRELERACDSLGEVCS